MTDRLFKILLEWFMVSDPWILSTEDHEHVKDFLDWNARIRGHIDWIDAYHKLGWYK